MRIKRFEISVIMQTSKLTQPKAIHRRLSLTGIGLRMSTVARVIEVGRNYAPIRT